MMWSGVLVGGDLMLGKNILSGECGAEMVFGRVIYLSRRAKDWTQEKLCRKVGRGKGYISRVENGRVSPPSVKFILRFARVLGIDPTKLLLASVVSKAPEKVHAVVAGKLLPLVIGRLME